MMLEAPTTVVIALAVLIALTLIAACGIALVDLFRTVSGATLGRLRSLERAVGEARVRSWQVREFALDEAERTAQKVRHAKAGHLVRSARELGELAAAWPQSGLNAVAAALSSRDYAGRGWADEDVAALLAWAEAALSQDADLFDVYAHEFNRRIQELRSELRRWHCPVHGGRR